MRPIVAAVAAACAVAGTAGGAIAQQNQQAIPGGQIVGSSYQLNGSGSMMPRSLPPVGMPIGSALANPNSGTPINPYKQPGFDPKLIVAPATGFPGSPYQEPDLLDKLYDKLGSITAFFKPSPPPRPTYTPGISRRNQERAKERMWRRD
jgi:hypothetical protein